MIKLWLCTKNAFVILGRMSNVSSQHWNLDTILLELKASENLWMAKVY